MARRWARRSSAIDVDWWIWALAGAVIVTALSIYGIRPSLYTDLALALIADGFLLLISTIIIVSVISDGNFTLEPLSPSGAPDDFTGLSLAVAFGVLIFLGFEQCFVLGEEVQDPRGNVPKAIYTALGLVGFVLFLATFALVLGFGEGGITRLNELFATEGTPWFALVREVIGSGWVDVLLVMIVLSILSNTIASHNAVVRIQYGMGRAHALPKQLGYTHPRLRTPHVAILAQMTLSVAITLVCGLVWSPESVFGFVGFMIGLAAALSFILIALAALRYFHETAPDHSPWRNYGVPALAILILTPVVITSFEPSPGEPLKWAPFVILGWVILGAVYLVYREMRREKIDVDYAFGAAGEPPAAGGTVCSDGGHAGTDDRAPEGNGPSHDRARSSAGRERCARDASAHRDRAQHRRRPALGRRRVPGRDGAAALRQSGHRPGVRRRRDPRPRVGVRHREHGARTAGLHGSGAGFGPVRGLDPQSRLRGALQGGGRAKK